MVAGSVTGVGALGWLSLTTTGGVVRISGLITLPLTTELPQIAKNNAMVNTIRDRLDILLKFFIFYCLTGRIIDYSQRERDFSFGERIYHGTGLSLAILVPVLIFTFPKYNRSINSNIYMRKLHSKRFAVPDKVTTPRKNSVNLEETKNSFRIFELNTRHIPLEEEWELFSLR